MGLNAVYKQIVVDNKDFSVNNSRYVGQTLDYKKKQSLMKVLYSLTRSYFTETRIKTSKSR